MKAAAIAVACVAVLMMVSSLNEQAPSAPAMTQLDSLTASESTEAPAVPPAVKRVRLASRLEETFATSAVKNLDLRFKARGEQCEILHVEGPNLYREMMESIGYGSVIYGTIVPGGVNREAESAGFRSVVFSNRLDNVTRIFGTPQVSAAAATGAAQCDEETAASMSGEEGAAGSARLAGPDRESLSWDNALSGEKIFDGSMKHVATIVNVNQRAGLIEVQYLNGPRELKHLSAVAAYWYVLK